MGEAVHCNPEATHLYNQYPSAIHSENCQVNTRAVAVNQFHASLPPSTALHPPHARPPALLPSAPLLQLARREEFQPVAALSAAHPTVIVSPHPETPTSERDPSRPSEKPSFTTAVPRRTKLDGNNGTVHGVHRSAPSMTSNGVVPTMGGRREDRGPVFPRSQRPSIVSQHSNSVPSTPLQLAREYESRSRSPSPNGGLGSHSPRSVSSEANGSMPTLRAPRPNRCKYETNAAFGRRRMPYISSDILEKPKEEPKKTLDPHEDEKLSGDMRELYDRLLPCTESTERRHAFVEKLENILHTEWPGNEFKVHVFGSSGNLLYTDESDVDVCIQTPMKRLEEMHMLAEALDKHGMEKAVCIPQAKVRIVKVWDPELKLACDMNVNNTLALENTRLIKTYVQIDDRVRPLAMIIKHWTKRRILNDAAFGGTISSYTWICMILNFLQTRHPPVLPSLHKYPRSKEGENSHNPSDSEFADDLDALKGFGGENTESLGQLLFQFFRRYGYELDYEKFVISVREGRLLTREEKMWHLVGLKKEARNRLCVEEPFNTERNLGNSADDFAWRGIHQEIRRAFELLADGGQLHKACEQYEFPPEEKTVFKKPVSTAKPILQTAPRGGRGAPNHRGRGGFGQKSNHSSQRRASSGASFGPNRSPFLNNTPLPAMAGPEYGFPHRGLNEQLHDQLYQQYLSLEMQSNSLRAQLMAQQRAQQAQQVQAAHMHAHAVAQAQAQAQGHNHNVGQGSVNGSPQKSPYMTGPSSPRLPEMGIQGNPLSSQSLYYYPFFDPTQSCAPVPQDGPRTNPSSPSLNPSVLRRGVHRSSNASDTGSIRSQSQPARTVPQQKLLSGYPPMPQFVDPSHFVPYPIARPAHEVPPSETVSETPYSPPPAYPETMNSSENSTPKEYVGYYVEEQPPARTHLQEYTVPQIPSYHEIIQRRRRVSPEVTQPLLSTALRRVSRSPSPLGGHVRSYSTGVTPPSGPGSQPLQDRTESTHPQDNSGPVIVNGSYPVQPRESRNRSETIDAFPSLEPSHPSALGIYVNPGDSYPAMSAEYRPQFFHEDAQAQQLSDMMRASIVNGSRRDVSSAEVNGLTHVPSGDRPPFQLPLDFTNHETVNGDRKNQTTDATPTRVQPPQWQPVSYGNGLKLLDTKNAPRAPPQEIKSAGLPLLSPVFETRTPSPTVSRQHDALKSFNGARTQPKDNHNQNRRASHAPSQALTPREALAENKENGRGVQKGNSQNNTKSSKPNTGSTNNNPPSWQTTSGGRGKSRKKKGNKGGEQKSSGEPLPANAAERKGG